MLATDAFRDKPTLEGTRVVLRPLGPEHAAALFRSTQDPVVRRLTGTHRDFTHEDIERWAATRAEHTDRLDLAIHRREDDAFVGDLALLDFDPANGSVGIRVALAHADLRGRGYGSGAMRLALDHAFGTVGVHRVALDVYAFNEGAIRTYERLGFRHEGRLRDALLWEGERHDALLMSVLRPEWDAAALRDRIRASYGSAAPRPPHATLSEELIADRRAETAREADTGDGTGVDTGAPVTGDRRWAALGGPVRVRVFR